MPATQTDEVVARDLARLDLMEQLAAARRRTDDLFAIVKNEFLYERSAMGRS